jgi:hypothetical protein
MDLTKADTQESTVQEPKKMNKRVKDLWVAALRSGEYEQGIGYLKLNSKAFCCLGVLCEVAVKEGVTVTKTLIDKTQGQSHPRLTYVYGKNETEASLPSEVYEWAECEHNPTVRFNNNSNLTTPLWKLNDINRLSFNEIANLIEHQL